MAAHFANAFFHDSFQCASPSRMKNAACASLGVDQNYRQAIGSENGKQNSGSLSYETIAREWADFFF